MTFASSWLKLREPVDQQARNRVVVAHLAAALSGRTGLSVVDLGAGTGASVRALADHLPEDTSWHLVDNDKELLAEASWRLPQEHVDTRTLDLDRELEAALQPAPDLIVCSALLDLVSEAWMTRLIKRATALKVPFYAALTYNGDMTLSPGDLLDPAVCDAVNQHQHGDKGFGPALGPDAATVTIDRFRAAGFSVESGRADWSLDADDGPLMKALVTGWAEAAGEVALLPPSDLETWLKGRLAAIDSGELRVRVGHVDILARP